MKKHHFITTLSFFVALLLGIFLTVLFPDITRLVGLAFLSIILVKWCVNKKRQTKNNVLWNRSFKLFLMISLLSQSVLLYEKLPAGLADKFTTKQTDQLIETIDSTVPSATDVLLNEEDNQDNHDNEEKEIANLYQVISGNQVYLTANNEITLYTLIGVNLPTDTLISNQTTHYLNEWLLNANTIQISLDTDNQINTNSDSKLIYLWIDGELIQNKLLAAGLVELQETLSSPYLSDLEQSENYARENQLGVWSATAIENNEQHHDKTNSYTIDNFKEWYNEEPSFDNFYY